VFTRERRNVFDEEVMDVTMLRVGKKRYGSALWMFVDMLLKR
jgi:hypothetical protein